MAELGFERAEPAETGRPGYDPRNLLKLYLYGYLNQIRSSRRLEAECRRNIELMWLLGRLYPDHKSIAEFRRMHRDSITAAGAQLVRFAQSCGLIRGEWIAIDGSKFRAVSSMDSVKERDALRRYLDEMECTDAKPEINATAVQSAMEKLRRHLEPEARFMPVARTNAPAYNVQTAVDAEHALIVAHAISLDSGDNRCLEPMADAVRTALTPLIPANLVADAGYSNGQQASRCEAIGMVPHVPATRGVNTHGDGSLLDRTKFLYQPESDTYRCPAGQTLRRKKLQLKKHAIHYQARAKDCGTCPLKSRCTQSTRRTVTRHIYEDVLDRMHQRATPAIMRLRRSTVEHPFGTLKYRIFGHPRFLLRGLQGTETEISLAVMAYNLKRMVNLLGAYDLAGRLRMI